jgi:hypothetical protein
MAYESCPTTLVDAPAQIVWRLLTQPEGWSTFFDIRVLHVEPPGTAIVGQRIHGESGPKILHLGVTMEFAEIDPARGKLGMIVQLPLGVTVREDLSCSAISETQCRVSYNCNFSFPPGWRGAFTRLLLRRELAIGPEDSLSRLKRAAELQQSGGAAG